MTNTIPPVDLEKAKAAADDPKLARVQQVKGLRKMLDGLLQQVKSFDPSSVEVRVVEQKLIESIMWLGMELKRVGTPNRPPPSRQGIRPSGQEHPLPQKPCPAEPALLHLP